MAAWQDVLGELSIDNVRRKYLRAMSQNTGRNVIAYYSAFLTNRDQDSGISDNDINGFMNAINGLDRRKGIDLILHTPGGTVSAAGAIVSYLHKMFGANIRCFIPQIAMSAGTMIACSCREIWMGKQSSIGPIDPQFGVISTGEVIEEYDQAVKEMLKNPAMIPIWGLRLSKYPPAFVGQCKKASDLSKEMVRKWLKSTMFVNDPQKVAKAQKIVRYLGDHGKTKQHDRHISADEALAIGLKIKMVESNQALQDALLTVHHAFMITFSNNVALTKIIENQEGHAIVNRAVGR